jgi:uncharacterized protein YegL
LDLEQNECRISAINEYHVACVLLLDTSGSMYGVPINNLNQAIINFKNQTLLDEIAKKRIDISIIEFNNSARIIQDFVPLTEMSTPTLQANGVTSMGEGIDLALDAIDSRKALYKEVGTPYYRPWVFLLTDGGATDDIDPAASRARELSEKKKVAVWAVGVGGYDKECLFKITDRVLELQDTNFPLLFEWLSNSLVKVSNSDLTGNKKIEYPDLPENTRVVPKEWD